ncbi:MAG: hypothetical protein BWY69_01232 [Planctomycetes bacterium ADurb.Bin401]|nr:MAG: hypothetical protein BWY69_01232 [Planctomycetes bacterium ADurb.Bin401]
MEQSKINKFSSRKRLTSLNQETCQHLNSIDDFKTEEILQTPAKKPLGQLLEKIAELPEVRYEKISTVRRQICMGEYQLDEKLDATIDMLLEDLIVES